MKSLAIEKIRIDGGTQMRAELSKETYCEYRDLFLAGVEFPPVDVFYDGSIYWLADGFHRYFGAKEAKQKTIAVTIYEGTQRDAILFSVGANQSNGLRRSNKDKRRSVLTMLEDAEWVTWSDRKIAESAGVFHEMVAKLRKQLAESSSSEAAKAKDKPRVGKDGKARKPPKPPAKPVKEIDLPTECEHEFDEDACIHCHEPKPKTTKEIPAITGGTSFDVSEIEAVANLTVQQKMERTKAKHGEMLNCLTAFTKHLNQITQNHDDAGHIITCHQSIRKGLGELREYVTASQPGAVCPRCSGQGCEFCSGFGWTTDHHERQRRSTK
jgi:hypothetical protein